MAKAEHTPTAKSFELESLASHYVPEQHETYLRFLQEAVRDPRNLNIALTGRYGTGKSSVLDAFESDSLKRSWRTWFKRTRKTLRITISTLGAPPVQPIPLPAAQPTAGAVPAQPATGTVPEASTVTNRIQKELVKQLIYRMPPRDFRFSRFNRIVPLSRLRAVARATAAVVLIGVVAWLFKLVPDVRGTGAGQWWEPMLSWLGIGAGAVIVLTTVLRIVHGRFAVSDLSAAGTTVKLSPRSMTYFDEYSEDIVSFFNKELPDVVIFEDLDRFDDPHIFEALRELNTLLNQTPERRRTKRPLRFVYAVRDSLFEDLGSGTDRANRTKFFDLVIPVVPFISHRNARELLDDLLRKRELTEIDRSLIALVAQHTSDMRLLTNICNEYVVFAARLLKQGTTAPGLTESNLFALIAYKNFHLKDFEQIFLSDGDLQSLYNLRKDLVRSEIDDCEKRKRDIRNKPAEHRTMTRETEQLADRLVAISAAIKQSTSSVNSRYLYFNVGEEQFPQSQLTSYRFWKAVATTNTIVVMATSQANGGNKQEAGRLDRDEIATLFPEALEAGKWEELDAQANQAEIRRLDAEVDVLRGADFQHLAQETRFTLSVEDGRKTFADLIDETIRSELARGLVKQGYLDRNFALYAAQFYGDFTGVDVARFIVQTVETNTKDVDYPFSGPQAIDSLLNEAPDYFSHTISAYNVQILDHLLRTKDERAAHVADTIVANGGKDADEFLQRYFNAGTQRERFATLLSSRQWKSVFTQLVRHLELPDDDRPALVDAALRGANNGEGYVVNDLIGHFIEDHYAVMKAFTAPQNAEVAAKIVLILEVAGGVLPDLAPLDEGIRALVVQAGLYRITADNLRVALDTDSDVSLDRVREQQAVYDLCRRFPGEYLDAVDADDRTRYSVLTAPVLVEVLAELPESGAEDEHAHQLIAMASPDIRLETLSVVPHRYWRDLAQHRLFLATIPNVQAYRVAIGSIDEPIAKLLLTAGSIDSADADENAKSIVAVHLLNSAAAIPGARQRVELVESLRPAHCLPVSGIEPEAGTLLALLLEHDLVEDSIESFLRFRDAGWSAIEPAIEQSEKFPEFMTPELVSDFLADLLRSSRVPDSAKEKILGELALYVPHDDVDVLRAAGVFAVMRERSLPSDQIARIAATVRDSNLTLKLLLAASTSVPETVSVLKRLGEPYSHFANVGVSDFKVPVDEPHQLILERLKDAGVIASFRKVKDSYNVKRAPAGGTPTSA